MNPINTIAAQRASAPRRPIPPGACDAHSPAKRSLGLTEEMPLREGYRYEQSQTAALAEIEDTKEALTSFREKRKPVFKGR